MTLKRIDCTPAEADRLLAASSTTTQIADVARLYEGEHPEHGHVICAIHTDGSATVFADEVRFLEDGSVPAPPILA